MGNRVIKFRGKSHKHGWIYGYYFVNRGEHFIVQDGKVENPLATYEDYIVDAETVSQFTGQLDADGKEIYEGDIVEYNVNRYEITFKDGAFFVEELISRQHIPFCYISTSHMCTIGTKYDKEQ